MTKAYSGMSRKPIKSLLLRGVNVTALVAGLAACVTGSMSPVSKTEVGSYISNRAYSLYYQGTSSSPDLIVLDTAGGLKMEATGWNTAGPIEAKTMLAGAVKGAGSFQTLFYTDDEETKHSEAFLFVGGAKDDLSFNFSPDPEAGTFTLSETASAGNSEGGDGGGDGGY